MKGLFSVTVLVYLFSALLFPLSIPAFAQVNADIIRPSINANQFGLAVKAETALSKGQLSLSIPLMELKGKGYDLPISLIFYNGDVTCTTEASPVGLGWALMAGGVITKTIRGTDDADTRWSRNHHYDDNYLADRFKDVNCHAIFTDDILSDPMPDEYTYSLPGHSGTIDVSFDGNTTRMSLYPDESYVIESTGKGYCITADDGTQFLFEDVERRTVGAAGADNESTSWFLTKITTTKGGVFTFNYATEEYVDLSTADENENYFQKFSTKRITSIASGFGTVTFNAAIRNDRGGIGNQPIASNLESKRINKIELKDEKGDFVKGYELNNDSLFKVFKESFEYQRIGCEWCNYRHKLTSVIQYDAAGNHLPPYRFSYSYKFTKSKLVETTYQNGECMPRNSWTSSVGHQAYVDLRRDGTPLCTMKYPNSEYITFEGLTTLPEKSSLTADDYFCLTAINYPTGATEEFIYKEHHYSKVNNTKLGISALYAEKIYGKRLASRIRHGSELVQRTDYVYMQHDAGYKVKGPSSGVMTNPSIHCATFYTPKPEDGGWVFRASRLSSGKAFNSFMGPPVCYTEVEEVEYDESGDTLNRTIHYFEPQIVSPPVNYIFVCPHSNSLPAASLVKIDNIIYGAKSGYTGNMSYCNNENYTYLAYPVGEFYNAACVVDKPLKEVFIGKGGKVRSIKEYLYYMGDPYTSKKYGYQVASQKYSGYDAYLISKSEYITRKTLPRGTTTTSYYYNGDGRDSICEDYRLSYNKGRVKSSFYSRSNENNNNERSTSATNYHFPDDIVNNAGNSAWPSIKAVNGLIEKNVIADPIKK